MLSRYCTLAMLVVVAGLSGCGMFKTEIDKCHEAREYQQAKPGPRARVPDGMDPLPDEARLPVPYGESNTEPTPEDEPCLIEPPDYRDTV